MLVPEVGPDCEEASGYEKPDVWRDADVVKPPYDQIIQDEADGFDKYIAANVLHLGEMVSAVGEGPVALDDVV